MPEYNGNILSMEDFVEDVCDDQALGTGTDAGRELLGLAAAYGALRSLDAGEQDRVLSWLNARITSDQGEAS